MVKALVNFIKAVYNFSDKYLVGLFDLFARLYIANIFFQSGLLKFRNYLNNNWDLTIEVFTSEHPPILRPEVMKFLGFSGDPIQIMPIHFAAFLGTFSEIFFSLLLAIGFLGRIGAFGLLMVTLIIQITYKDLNEHYYWFIILGMFFVRGAGKISIDHLIKVNFLENKSGKQSGKR
jgi:uncharacterized membrane protein YphA (DoxX/SURF4 family)